MTNIIDEFIKQRISNPIPNKWCLGFSSVYNYAITYNLPIIGIWLNTINCDYCKKFILYLLEPGFIKWMNNSNCMFYIGCDKDTTNDDKKHGKGYNWIKNNRINTICPIIRIYWEKDNNIKINSITDGKLIGSFNNNLNIKELFQKLLQEHIPFNKNNIKASKNIPDNKNIFLGQNSSNNALKTMFGLNKDCTITTKDNKILKYYAATKTIKYIQDYNTNEFLAISKNI